MRELTHRTFQNFLQKNGRRHVGLQFYACASCSPAHPLRSPSAVSPLSLATCTSRYIALKQLPIDQLSFTSSSCASKVRENGRLQTLKQLYITDRQTPTQDNYSNPRACAPRLLLCSPVPAVFTNHCWCSWSSA